MFVSLAKACKTWFHRRSIGIGYMRRWVLADLYFFKVYLHHFTGPDSARDPHDHPRRFFSLCLKGSYLEDYWEHDPFYHTASHHYCHKAGRLRTFPATHVHKVVSVTEGGCWTLCVGLRPYRQWGFYTPQGWVPWHRYPDCSAAAAASPHH